jgi:hypothetical protein
MLWGVDHDDVIPKFDGDAFRVARQDPDAIRNFLRLDRFGDLRLHLSDVRRHVKRHGKIRPDIRNGHVEYGISARPLQHARWEFHAQKM